MNNEATKCDTVIVDCEKGREMGCSTFCCRLLVRLKPHEMEQSDGQTAAKGFVDKDEEGYCIHADKETGRCGIWENRPEVCREYTCNDDFMLQVVLREGFKNIAETAKRTVTIYVPLESFLRVPGIEV